MYQLSLVLAYHPTACLTTLSVLMILYVGKWRRALLGRPATGPGGARWVPTNICGLGGLCARVSQMAGAVGSGVSFHPMWPFPTGSLRIPHYTS